jgi:hypothetical protein
MSSEAKVECDVDVCLSSDSGDDSSYDASSGGSATSSDPEEPELRVRNPRKRQQQARSPRRFRSQGSVMVESRLLILACAGNEEILSWLLEVRQTVPDSELVAAGRQAWPHRKSSPSHLRTRLQRLRHIYERERAKLPAQAQGAPIPRWTPEAKVQLDALPVWWQDYHCNIALSETAIRLSSGKRRRFSMIEVRLTSFHHRSVSARIARSKSR